MSISGVLGTIDLIVGLQPGSEPVVAPTIKGPGGLQVIAFIRVCSDLR